MDRAKIYKVAVIAGISILVLCVLVLLLPRSSNSGSQKSHSKQNDDRQSAATLAEEHAGLLKASTEFTQRSGTGLGPPEDLVRDKRAVKRMTFAAEAALNRSIGRKLFLARFPAAKDGAQIVFPENPNVDFASGAFPLDKEATRWVAQLRIVDWQDFAFDPGMDRAPLVEGIFILDVKDGSRKPLVQSTEDTSYRLVSSSPDGRYALVSRQQRKDASAIWCLIDIRTKEELPLQGTENATGRCSWDDAGNLYFAALIPGKSSALYRTSISSSKPQLLLDQFGDKQSAVGDPTSTSDGKYVYFGAISREIVIDGKKTSAHSNRSILRLNILTNKTEKICDGQEPVFVPEINGLAYIKSKKGSTREIFLHDLASGSSSQLTHGEGFSHVVDNGKLYFISNRQFGHATLFSLGMSPQE